MSAENEQTLNRAEARAVTARNDADQASGIALTATIDFIDLALGAHWSWERIGRGLGVSGTAARRYYDRNRRRVHNGAG